MGLQSCIHCTLERLVYLPGRGSVCAHRRSFLTLWAITIESQEDKGAGESLEMSVCEHELPQSIEANTRSQSVVVVVVAMVMDMKKLSAGLGWVPRVCGDGALLCGVVPGSSRPTTKK